MIWFFILILFVGIVYMIKNKIRIDFASFFRKGFKKINDKYGCYCWIGKQGDGKTLGVVTFINNVRRKGQKVITNMKAYYERNKEFCIYENNFYEIIDKFEKGFYDTNYIVFYDELFTLLEKGKLNKDILTFISQMRKRGVYLLTTVQEWLDINVTFRRYCRYYIECHSFNILGRCFSWNVVHDGYQIHWDNLLNEYDAPIIQTNFHKNSKKIADSYDTFEVIHDTARDKVAKPR